MQKVLLMSILVATVAIPAWAAKDPSARRGLKRAIFFVLVFDVVYLLSLLVIYPRL